MRKRDFFRQNWGQCLLIWLPQVIATLIAAFLFHRLTDCVNCLFGIRNPSWANFKINSAQDGSVMYVTAELYVSMFAVLMVIIFSNFHFLIDIPIQAVKQAAVDRKNDGKQVSYLRSAQVLTGLSLALSVAWGVVLVLGVRTDYGPRLNEYAALAIFSLFCIIDFAFMRSAGLTLRNASHTSTSNTTAHMELTRRLFHDSLWFVDVPVVLGVTIVLIFSRFSETHLTSLGLTSLGQRAFGNAFGPDQLRLVLSIFVIGVSAGATVTHLAVSQFIFGVLRTRDLFRRSAAA